MNTPARQLLTEFVLEKAAAEALPLRMQLYRALAAELPETTPEFQQLTALADDIEAIEEKHLQLVLDFKRNARGKA